MSEGTASPSESIRTKLESSSVEEDALKLKILAMAGEAWQIFGPFAVAALA